MEDKDQEKDREETGLGFDLYPNRRSGRTDPSLYDKLFRESSDAEISKAACERNIQLAFQRKNCPLLQQSLIMKALERKTSIEFEMFSDPLLKLLRGALKNAGCPIDLKRHMSCEDCDRSVQGGYDSEFNQIVVCKNVYKARDTPDTILLHELIHMYDFCSNNIDFRNPEHLACTEIRAANISHCSFLSSWLAGQTSLFDFKKTHQYCVKMRAAYSLVVARNMDFKTALNYVLKVFDKCYNDLEPVGRRLRRKSLEPVMAYEEAKCFNISD